MAALPSGYFWSPKIPDPMQLSPMFREYWGVLQPGYYDFATMPFGDNWSLLKDGNAYSTIRLDTYGDVSIQPRFPVDEPSAGFFFTMRGPYADPSVQEGNRGVWRATCPPAGMVFGRLSAPLYGHIGSRYDRYYTNGYPWLAAGYYPEISNPCWDNGTPVGPKKFFSDERITLLPCQLGPDLTKLSSIPNVPVYISITAVDCFGRETKPSPPLVVNPKSGTDGNSYIGVLRAFPFTMGVCGAYVYAGFSPDQMFRQPVLNYVGSTPKYLWPIWLQQYILHEVINTGIRPKPPTVDGVASILNSPQKQIVDGKRVIVYNADEYNLYCPFMLPYDSLNFGRVIGNANRRCTFKQQSKWIDGRDLQVDYPCLYIQNQRDRMCDAVFIADYAPVGVTFSDWSGGQGFSDCIERCSFYLGAEDTIGFLIDERSSEWAGNHTASETRVRECSFAATIPVKVEGNQTANVKFLNRCGFYATGNTRYKANTVGCVYACSPNDFDFMDLEGIGGTFRAIAACGAISGPPNVTISDFFIDQGCPVYASFANYVGGKIAFLDGERINAHPNLQNWARLAEAPTALSSIVQFNNIRTTDQASAISFQMNQLSLNLDFPIAEFITPDEKLWVSRGLPLEYADPKNPAYYNWKVKRVLNWMANYQDMPDTLKIIPSLIEKSVAKVGVFNMVKSFFLRSK